MRVVFILNEFSLHNHLVERAIVARPDDEVAIVKVPLVLKGKSRADTAARILPKLSRRFIVWKLQEFLAVSAITVVPKILSRGAVFRRLRAIARRYDLAFHRSENVMSDATLAFVREQQPDIIVTLMHQIVKRELIAIPRLGVINIHPGLLPEFRGIQPYFWELMTGHEWAGPSSTIFATNRLIRASSLLQLATGRGLDCQSSSIITSPSAARRSYCPRCFAESNPVLWCRGNNLTADDISGGRTV